MSSFVPLFGKNLLTFTVIKSYTETTSDNLSQRHRGHREKTLCFKNRLTSAINSTINNTILYTFKGVDKYAY